jgi:hypothetical protein
MSKKDITNEELARMIAKGFENAATKTDISDLKSELKQDIEDLDIKMSRLAYDFDVKDLKKRMSVVERKIGIK